MRCEPRFEERKGLRRGEGESRWLSEVGVWEKGVAGCLCPSQLTRALCFAVHKYSSSHYSLFAGDFVDQCRGCP